MAFTQQLQRTTGFVLPARNARMLTSKVTARPARFIVRAEGPKEVVKDLKGKVEDVLDNKVGPASRDAVTSTTQRSVQETRPEQQPDTFGKIMSFSGPAPERINSRLAMIGIVAALSSELRTHVGVLEQIKTAPVPIALTFLTFIIATVVPSLRGVSPEAADRWNRPLRDLFSEKAEIYNGRLAMGAFASLIIIEAILGRPSLG
jgi:hypothetical protein